MKVALVKVLPDSFWTFLSKFSLVRRVRDHARGNKAFFYFLYGVRGIAKSLPDGTCVVELDSMTFHLPSMQQLSVIFEILRERVYERVYSLRRGYVVIDVGAHVGVFSVMAARVIGEDGVVLAIEPEPKNLKFLQENIVTNGVERTVRILRGAAGREKGKGKLYLSEHSTQHSFYTRSHVGEYMKDFIEVNVDSLDDIVINLGIRKVDFIKIDVQGWELEVLNGMTGILGLPAVNIAIAAYHSLPDGTPEAPRVINFFESRGVKAVDYKNGFVYAET